MTGKVDKLEQQIKALQAKKRAAKKQEKAKQEKIEFERLKEMEKKLKELNKEGAFTYAKQGEALKNLLVKHEIKTFEEGFEILERAIVSMKSQQ